MKVYKAWCMDSTWRERIFSSYAAAREWLKKENAIVNTIDEFELDQDEKGRRIFLENTTPPKKRKKKEKF